MGRFIVRHLIQAVPTFFGITLLTFVIVRLAPGDPVTLLAAGAADMTAEDLTALRRSYGLDQPLPVQYVSWLGHIVTGDLGRSLLYRRPVTQMISTTLQGATGRRRCRVFSRLTWRLVRQRACGSRQRSVQSRGHPHTWPLAVSRAGRAGYRRVSRLVEPRRLHGAISDMPPVEFEALYHQKRATTSAA